MESDLPMTSFRLGQRVHVRTVGEYQEVHLVPTGTGNVVRLRMKDDGAWIRLDERNPVPGAHPFPANDERGRDVVAFPHDCDEVGR